MTTFSLGEVLRRPWARWGLLVVFWTFVGLVFVAYQSIILYNAGARMTLHHAVWICIGQYFWVLLTPLVVHLARRYPVERAGWARRVGQHLGLAVVIVAAESFAFAGLQAAEAAYYGEAYPFVNAFFRVLLRSIVMDVLFYVVIVAVVHALDYNAKTSRLQAQLAQAQLQALRMQLNPHFLFNTLHTISALMDEDVRGARRMMASLSELLRYTLDGGSAPEVPLSEELDFLERYLEIEQARFQDRLVVSFEVDPAVRDALLPNLILQPLVENAVRHGIAPYAAEGRLVVRAQRREGRLVIHVEDNGPGLRPGRRPGRSARRGHSGIGLKNTRERLAQRYGSDHRFALKTPPGGGLCVELDLPLHTRRHPEPVEA